MSKKAAVAKKKTKTKKPEGVVILNPYPPTKDGVDIGAAVRMYRQGLNMSTTELAKKVGISQAQVSRLENNLQGFRSDTLRRIAKHLKVRPWVLFMTQAERVAAAKSEDLDSRA